MSSVWHFRAARVDKDVKIIFNRCDICDSPIPEAPDDLQCQIDRLDEINNSFTSEYDKLEPKLLLCSKCQKEYDIPSWAKIPPSLK